MMIRPRSYRRRTSRRWEGDAAGSVSMSQAAGQPAVASITCRRVDLDEPKDQMVVTLTLGEAQALVDSLARFAAARP